MSYKVTYGPTAAQICHQRKGMSGLFAAGILLLLCVLAGSILPIAKDYLQISISPFGDEATVIAFESMIHRIGEGTSVSEAVVVFCQEIIENAQPFPQ